MKVVIAAAGTGGHINPGIAIANKIMKEEPNSKIIFIGTKRGLETKLVPRAGYELKTIESFGISRSLSVKNIKRLVKTIGSIGESKKILKEFKPDLIIGTGGYICISVCLAAKKLKIPYILHESNVLPGVATKLLSKNAEKILVGFEEAKERLPKAKQIVLTGTPTKVNKLQLTKEEIKEKKEKLGFDANLPLVLVFGGSQGARSINTSMLGIIEKEKNTNYQIMWAAGPEQYEIVKNKFLEKNIDINKIKGIKIVPYIYEMEEIMNISDLVVSRSGAMTISEVAITGKPAIFVPYPFATENHQEYNARVLQGVGAAEIILDSELNSEILNNTIENIVSNKSKLEQMGKNTQRVVNENVEEKIYTQIKGALLKSIV